MHLPYELPRDEVAAARREIEGAGLRIVGGGLITFEQTRRRRGEVLRYARRPDPLITAHADVHPAAHRAVRQAYDIKVAIHTSAGGQAVPSPYDA